ncbi:MAG: hypothetical protein IPL39_02065 [Opitutaceae bacterium]|nr:hypothetical protein [Opitutaceae bacterium]
MSALDPKRWDALWTRLLPAGNAGAAFRQLESLYSQPVRRYHNAAHIAACLRELDTPLVTPANVDALEFAIWFHDAIYDPKASDNEEQSAALARECIAGAGGSPALTTQVGTLVLSTKTHDPECATDARWLIDIDLSILGKSEREFDAYETAIHAEYSWVDDTLFRQRRAAILEQFLSRTQIFSTEPFHSKYEVPARANLRRSITKLQARAF